MDATATKDVEALRFVPITHKSNDDYALTVHLRWCPREIDSVVSR